VGWDYVFMLGDGVPVDGVAAETISTATMKKERGRQAGLGGFLGDARSKEKAAGNSDRKGGDLADLMLALMDGENVEHFEDVQEIAAEQLHQLQVDEDADAGEGSTDENEGRDSEDIEVEDAQLDVQQVLNRLEGISSESSTDNDGHRQELQVQGQQEPRSSRGARQDNVLPAHVKWTEVHCNTCGINCGRYSYHPNAGWRGPMWTMQWMDPGSDKYARPGKRKSADESFISNVKRYMQRKRRCCAYKSDSGSE
jgi:hypothetical protein